MKNGPSSVQAEYHWLADRIKVAPVSAARSGEKSLMPRFALVFIVSIAVISAGCFSNSNGTVSGKVTFNGKPLDKGQVMFSPTGATGGTAGGEIVAGKYEVADITPASYQVTVAATPEVKIVMPGDPETKRALTDEELRARIDPLPADTTGKEQTLEVKGGSQTLDFKLESKAGK
jgi:hypothetical protein